MPKLTAASPMGPHYPEKRNRIAGLQRKELDLEKHPHTSGIVDMSHRAPRRFGD
jgi:hypothetical protein